MKVRHLTRPIIHLARTLQLHMISVETHNHAWKTEQTTKQEKYHLYGYFINYEQVLYSLTSEGID